MSKMLREIEPELKARAFTISGVTAFDVLQRVRDEVATVPAGARWDDAKKKIVEEIHPFLADPEDPDNTEAAERRAETILRTHGFQAYQAANYRNIEAQPGVFPFVMYQSMDDDRVRPAHAALEGMVFPFDSEFVQSHWCPWDWGCRCHWTPISEDDAREVREADAKRPPEARDFIQGRDLEHLQTTRSLVRGVNEIYDLRTPKEKGDPGAFTWNPKDLRIPVEKLKERYDSTVWAAFEKWAMHTPITSIKQTVWEWMSGKAIIPATAPIALPVSPVTKIEDIISTLGLDKKISWEKDDIRSLRKALIKKDKVDIKTKLEAIGGNDLQKKGVGSKAWVRRQFKEILSYLPREIAEALPKLTINIDAHAGGAFGSYDHIAHSIQIGRKTCLGSPGGEDQFHETVWHEIMHWIHFHGPQSYRDSIADHFQSRTNGEPIVHLAPYNASGRRDKWWDAYAGTQYVGQGFDSSKGQGIEVPTRYFQLLTNSEKLIRQRDPMFQPYAAEFDETFLKVLRVFTGEHTI